MKIRCSVLIPFVCISLFSCDIGDSNPDSDANNFAIEGKTYVLRNYILESSVDLNGDAVFSTDLLEEDANCFVNEITFLEDNTLWPPNRRTIAFTVIGNNTQDFHCVEPDGGKVSYMRIDETIEIGYNGQFYYSGELSDNNTVLTFLLPFEHLLGFGFFGENDYLDQSGAIVEYTGNATLVYELLE